MPDIDKNIIITPNRGSTFQPSIVFTGQGVDPITLRVLDGTTGTGLTAGGAVSFEGSAGQLFSVVNRLGTGSIFSVNDISGIPSIDVDANGRIHMAAFTGFIGIGLTAPADKLHVVGNIRSSGFVNASGGVSASNGTFANDIFVNNDVRVGLGSGNLNTNTVLGSLAFNSNTTGDQNVVVGRQALTASVTGSQNVAIGRRSLFQLVSGTKNTAIGNLTLSSFNGTDVVAVGTNAGNGLMSGSGGIYIGSDSAASASSRTNEIVIGPSTTGLGSSTTIIGPSTQTLARINGLLDVPSGICASGISSGAYILTSAGIKSLTGTTYTFLASDNGDVLTHDNASGCTLTIPTGLPVGFSTTIIRLNATGRVGFTAASGVTLNVYGGFTGLAGQHASASLISYASNIFNLSGNLI
jgi:hypothetical protein